MRPNSAPCWIARTVSAPAFASPMTFAFEDCACSRKEEKSGVLMGAYVAPNTFPPAAEMNSLPSETNALVDSLGWNEFAVVGHWMGGKAALLTTTLATKRVTRLCGITPVWAAPAPFDAETLKFFRTAAELASVRQAIIHNTAGGRLTPYWSGSVAARSMETYSSRAFAEYLESWALRDVDERPPRLATA